jgi:hypothetical protein
MQPSLDESLAAVEGVEPGCHVPLRFINPWHPALFSVPAIFVTGQDGVSASELLSWVRAGYLVLVDDSGNRSAWL